VLTAHPLIRVVLAVGICALLVWIVRRAARPTKLALRDTPGRPNRLSPRHIALAIAVYLTPAVLLRIVCENPGYSVVIPVTIASQLACLAVSIALAARTFRHGLRRGLGLSMRHWIYDTARGIIAYFTVIPFCLGLFWIVHFLAPLTEQDVHRLLRLLPTVPVPWRVVMVLQAVILAPLVEEVFFRGLLQSLFRKHLRSPWVAILLTSLCFALIHWPYWKSMPSLGVLAIALGYNYERCGRIWPVVLTHALFNAVNITVALT